MYYVDTIEENSSNQLGSITDVSQGGIRISTPKSLQQGEVLRVKLATHNKDNNESIEIECCWSRSSENTHNEAGFKFNKISEQMRDKISKLP